METRSKPHRRNFLLAGILVLALFGGWMLSTTDNNNDSGARHPGATQKQDTKSSPVEVSGEKTTPHEAPSTLPPDAPPANTPPSPSADRGSSRSAQRKYADTVRQRAAQKRLTKKKKEEAQQAARNGADSTESPPEPPPLSEEERQKRRQYIQRTIREQYFPVARSCYEELLSRQPKAAGKMVMAFDIVGFADAGVVDQVELQDGTTIDDPEFELCMRESMYTTVFEAPPGGAEKTTVVYPIELSPDGEDQ